MPPVDGIIVSKLGAGGFALYPDAPEVSPWIQNLTRDSDGSWRPRYGLSLVRAMPARIAMLHGTYQADVSLHTIYMLTQGSQFYQGTLATIASAAATSMVSAIPLANWNSEYKNAASAVGTSSNPTSTAKRLMFSFPGFGVAAQPVYDQTLAVMQFDGTGDIKGVPFSHGLTACVVQKSTIVWSTYGDAYAWPVLNNALLNPDVGEGIAGCYLTEDLSYIFGSLGVMSVQGPLLLEAKWRMTTAPAAAGPGATNIVRCRDKIIYLAPGPSIYALGGGVSRIDGPIQQLLATYGDSTYFSMWFDPLIDCCCITPLVDQTIDPGKANDTYLFSVGEGKWIGTFRHADSTKGLSRGFSTGPVSDSSSVPRNAPPFAAVVVAAHDLLTVYDHELYADHDSGGGEVAFTCAIEAGPAGDDAQPHIDKQLLDVYVEGTGTWEVILKHRSSQGQAFSEVSLGTVVAPGWVYAPANTPCYKERIVRLEALSSSDLRVRNLGIRERALGA